MYICLCLYQKCPLNLLDPLVHSDIPVDPTGAQWYPSRSTGAQWDPIIVPHPRSTSSGRTGWWLTSQLGLVLIIMTLDPIWLPTWHQLTVLAFVAKTSFRCTEIHCRCGGILDPCFVLVHKTVVHTCHPHLTAAYTKEPTTGRLLAYTQELLRERPFHYLGGGLEDLFSADYFFHLMFKAGFFFTYQLKPDFFSQRIESQINFL